MRNQQMNRALNFCTAFGVIEDIKVVIRLEFGSVESRNLMIFDRRLVGCWK